MSRKFLVWDLPTRLFHWLLAASFLGAWWISESERWRLSHALLGVTVIVLVCFRLFWGAFGSGHARFATWTLAPARVLGYFRAILRRQPEHFVGHNPAGAWAVLALMVLTLSTAVSGWIAFSLDVPEAVAEVHEVLATLTLWLVGVHVTAVILSSVLHRESLIGGMLHGFKRADGPTGAQQRVWVAIILLAVVLAILIGWIPLPGIRAGASLLS